MRKYFFLTASAALLLGYGSVSAEIKSPYIINFDSEINTKAHDFKVDLGWGHIVDSYKSYYSTYYVDYGYRAGEGVDGSGCLYVGSQTLGDYDTQVRDLLVTPVAKGVVSLAVKLSNSYSGAIKFYKVEKVNGKFQPTEEITPANMPELNADAFQQVTIATNADSYIGIWGNNVLIDNFMAQKADVVLTPSMKIAGVKLTSKSQPDCDATGKFPVKMNVSVVNDGETVLKPGDENYSLSLLFAATNDSLATTPINQEIAVGDTAVVELAADVDYEKYKGYKRYDVKENMNGAVTTGTYVDPIAYAPKIVLRQGDSKMDSGDDLAFGMVKADSTMTFTLTNEGAKELKITSVAVPEGFSTSLQAPLSLPAHSDPQTFTVTIDGTTPGIKSGEMVIKADEADDYTLNLSGTVLDASKFFANFEDGKMPTGMLYDANYWEVKKWKTADNAYVLHAKKSNCPKAILPLLEFAEGEKFTFDAGKKSFSSKIRVYYSPDRQHWTLAKEIAASDMPGTYVGGGSYEYKLGAFVVDGIPAGKQYIAFEADNAHIDNIYGGVPQSVAHDLTLGNVTLPQTGTVNHAYTAQATITNVNLKEETDYKLAFFVDGVALDSVKDQAIASGESLNASFSYTPHKAGDHTVYMLLTAGDLKISTDTVSVAVGEEVASADVTIGEPAEDYSSNMPLNTYYKNSESEVIYTASQLNLTAGQKLSGISFKGYNDGGHIAELPTHIKVWLENTNDETYAEPYAEHDKTAMTAVYDADYTFNKKGSKEAPEVVLSLRFATPFEYTGKNLRIVMRSSNNIDNYQRVNYQPNGDDKTHAIGRWKDGDLSEASYYAKPQPVITLSVAQEPTAISGQIIDCFKTPVADATVKLVSGDVIYEGCTDEEGQYRVPVIQTDKTYQATIHADGYLEAGLKDVNLAEGDVVSNVTLDLEDRVFTPGVPCFICLPKSLTPDEAEAVGSFYTTSNDNRDNKTDGATFETDMVKTTNIIHSLPYLFVPKVAVPFPDMAHMTIQSEVPGAQLFGLEGNELALRGNYSPSTAKQAEDENLFSIGGAEDDVNLTPVKTLRMNAFDAALSSKQKFTTVIITLKDNGTTGIHSAKNAGLDKDAKTVYNLNGQQLDSSRTLKKGLYIINGVKVIIK